MLEFSHKRHQLQDVALQLTRHMSPVGNSDKRPPEKMKYALVNGITLLLGKGHLLSTARLSS